MYYCLNKNELSDILDFTEDNSKILNNSLNQLFMNAQNWEGELGALSYLFSQIIEKKSKQGIECSSLIKLLYTLAEEIYFSIEEFDHNFIDFMMKNIRNKALTLEEELVDLQNRLSNFEFDKIVRL